MIERSFELAAGEVRTVNLRDWVVLGRVPAPALGKAKLAHVQAALTGQPSPEDGLYYGIQADPGDPELAAGYVTLRVQSSPRRDSLWGDYFWVDADQNAAEGELLVDVDRSSPCGGLCDLHRLRFLDGGGFDGGTQLVIWCGRRHEPSPIAETLSSADLLSLSAIHSEPGVKLEERVMELQPVQLVDVRDLSLSEPFGWMDLATDEEIYVGVRYSADKRYAVTLQTWCLREPPPEAPPPDPPDPPDLTASIDLEKSTNGEDADTAPGPRVGGNGSVTWEYVVTNTGEASLTGIVVTDDLEGTITCPGTELAAGDSMTCTHGGTAPAAAAVDYVYANVGTVTGTPPDGPVVEDEDPSHYWVEGDPGPDPEPLIGLEKTRTSSSSTTRRAGSPVPSRRSRSASRWSARMPARRGSATIATSAWSAPGAS